MSELPIKERSSLPMFSSPLWPPIEPNGPFALRRRRFWPLFLTNRQAPKTSPVEVHPRGEAPRRTYHRASRRELPSSGCRPSKQYARLIPILLTNCVSVVTTPQAVRFRQNSSRDLRVRFGGHITVKLMITPDHMTQSHEFKFDLDQTYLGPFLDGCRSVLSRWPVRAETSA